MIFAIGQAADLDPFAEDVAITPRRTIETAAFTFETSRPDVFAAGDAASGPASAIQAIAGGREAAFSMDRYLRGGQILANRAAVRETVDKDRLPGEGVLLSPRNERAVTDATNELLKKNAATLKQGTIEIAKESERGIVDIETLQQTNKQLIETLDELNKIRADGKAKRANAEQELGRIEGELRQKMLEINN